MKGVIYEKCAFDDSRFVCGGKAWSAPYLYRMAKDRRLKREVVKLRHLDLSASPWGSCGSIDDIAWHAIRAKRADQRIPIIMEATGRIMDGWHRVLAAIIRGDTTITAYRFDDYIEPDGVE
jgi:hypothetical protein